MFGTTIFGTRLKLSLSQYSISFSDFLMRSVHLADFFYNLLMRQLHVAQPGVSDQDRLGNPEVARLFVTKHIFQ